MAGHAPKYTLKPYVFSKKLKRTSYALMVLGILGIAYGFLTAPRSLEETKEILAKRHDAHGGHGVAHGDHHTDTHAADTHTEEHASGHDDVHQDDHEEGHTDTHDVNHQEKHTDTHASGHDDAHAEHAFHQMQNRPWTAFYVALFFAFGITLLVLTFNAIQRVAQSGWSIVFFRIMEGITGNLLPVTIILLVFLLLGSAHVHHLFIWMKVGTLDPTSPNYDPIIAGKSMWLNVPGWSIRAVVYIFGWNLYRYILRKKSLLQDTATDLRHHKKNFTYSVAYLAFFLITESMMSWDWIMSLDPHWFSTLFGWYILASFIVCAVTVIAMVAIYLDSRGYLPFINNSHLHDLAKFMFGFSIFWTYLWFSQFMLIWYSDMPEETTYYLQRFQEYKYLFLGMVLMNFVFPILLLINSDYKRVPHFVIATGVVILAGHYIDFFVMIMPATVGAEWQVGIPELGSLLFFVGMFIFATFRAISKVPLIPKGNPFLKESELFHY